MHILADSLAYQAYHSLLGRTWEWLRVHYDALFVDLATLAVVLVIGWIVDRLIVRHFIRLFGEKDRLTDLKTHMYLGISRCLWWAAIVLASFWCFNINILPAVAGLGVVGIVVGFAFQESLSSAAAGVMLSFSNPFRVGDEVAIAGYQGYMLSFGYCASVIRTYDNRVVTIPNKNIWGQPIVNFSRMESRRIESKVGIAYESDVEAALKAVQEGLLASSLVLKDPQPKVFVSALADSSVELTAWIWCATADYWSLWRSASAIIKASLDQHGIAIPFPQLVVHKA